MFDVRVFNYALTSNDVVALLPDPVISAQPPQSLNVYVGGTVKIGVTASALKAPVTNQWQHDGTNLVDGPLGGSIISGANSTVLTLGNVTTSVQGVYRLIVSDPNGTVISSNTTVTVFSPQSAPTGNLVGAWITGAANLTDTSGHSPAGTHNGYGVTSAGLPASNYVFTNDLPPQATGQSVALLGNTAIAITNSSVYDGGYVNTFDDSINTAMSVTLWAKGWPAGWNPWVSKWGESGQGWQLRRWGNNNTTTFTIRGTGSTDDPEGSIQSNDGKWHHYAGTYDSATGIRRLYVDGILASQTTGNGPYTMTSSSHLAIGGRDNGGNTFDNYFVGDIYGVRVYNIALTEAQINSFMPTNTFVTVPVLPVPVLYGNKLVLSWSSGTLLQATNLTGPWVPVPGATSPYTNDVTTAPRGFFRLSNP